MFKKRSVKASQSAKASSYKADAELDVEASDELTSAVAPARIKARTTSSFIPKQARSTPGTPSNRGASVSQPVNDVVATPVVINDTIESREENFIPLDEGVVSSEAEVNATTRFLNDLEMDEGAGFEDEELALGESEAVRRAAFKRNEIASAIDDKYDESGSSSDEWEEELLRRATGAARSAYKPVKKTPKSRIENADVTIEAWKATLHQLKEQQSALASDMERLSVEKEAVIEAEAAVRQRMRESGERLLSRVRAELGTK